MNLYSQRQSVENRLRTLTNPVLKEILGNFGLAKTGVKAILQTRLLEFLHDAVNNNHLQQYQDLSHMINNQGQRPAAANSSSNNNRATPISPAASAMAPGFGARPTLPALNGSRGFGSSGEQEREQGLPFCRVLTSRISALDLQTERILSHSGGFDTVDRPARYNPKIRFLDGIYESADTDPEMPSNRHTVPTAVSLSSSVVDRLRTDSSLRVMLYCATPTLTSTYQRSDVDIAFPNQLEVKMNQEEVKSNYKGLKNKPGTTKPADLTSFIRKTPNYANNLTVTYALTSKVKSSHVDRCCDNHANTNQKFSIQVNLVRKSSAEELTEKIRKGKVITKERVLQESKLKLM